MTNPKTCFALHEKICVLLLAIFFSLTLFPSLLAAQDASEKGLPFVTNFHPNDYHSYSQNWSVIEDSSGLMYFGNQGYLMEYDGVKWKRTLIASSGTTATRALVKNKNGTIYYGSISEFGYLAKDSLGQTKLISLVHFIPPALRNFSDVWSICVTDEGVYFQAREKLFRFTENKEGKGVTGEVKIWEPTTRFMYSFYLDGTLYIHQQKLGLYKMVNDSLVKIPGSDFLGKERLQVMLPYPSTNGNKTYLVGMMYSGLYFFDGKSFTRFRTDADSLLAATLYKGLVLKDGSFALATAGKGLVIINKEGKILQVINRQAGLQDESVYGITVDNKNNLWLALDNGISRVQTSSPLSQFTIQSGITTSVLCMERFKGVIYLGTTNGLLRFNNAKRIFESIKDVSTNQVFALLVTDDELLQATDGLFSIKNNKVILVEPSLSGSLQLASLYHPKKYPNIVLGGDAIHGLSLFYKKKKVEKDSSEWKFGGYFSNVPQQIWSLAEDKDGVIWLGTQNEVVYRLHIVFDSDSNVDLKNSTIDTYGKKDGLTIGCGPVFAIKGTVYFGGDSSWYVYNKATNRFIKDSTIGNFPNAGGRDEISANEDYAKRVWVRFGKESAVLTPQPDGKYKIDRTPLMPIGERTINMFYNESDGITWIPTTDGLVRYDENMKKGYDQSFKILIRKIEAGNSLLDPGSSDSGKSNSISYNNNSLRFEYAAPFYEQEDRTKYQTWMEGFEKGWSEWGTNSYKEYTNLSEGKYHFHVRAKNVFQNISEEAIYNFTVEPPLLRTWWAYLLYALAALAIVYLIIRYRTKKLHEQRMELEKKIQERTHEVQVQAEELTTVNQISQALASQLNLDDLIKLVGDEMKRVFKANIVYLAMLDKKTNTLNFPYQYGEVLPPMKYGEGIASKIIATGKPLLLNKNLNEQISQLGIQRLGLPSSSYLGVPIPIDDEIIGVLSVQSTTKENYFDEKDERLLSTIAANVGVALKKARLFEEVKHAKSEAEEAGRNAERANEAKSAFLSTVSHELRTPLTSVLGFAKIIKKRLEERIFPATDKTDPKTEKAIGQVSENLNVVISEGERLTHLINDVLDLAKIEAGKMEWNMENVSMAEIVDRAVAATSSLFYQKNIVLEKFIEPDLPKITGDHDKLIQVIVNLISNAVKFTEQGSISCNVSIKGGEIITSIKDTGIGIAQKDQSAVFEQFKQIGGDTLTDKPKGTGLGLPICKEIVEHHGGRIWLESEPGKGSTFSFALPAVATTIVSSPIHLDALVKQLREQMAQSKLSSRDGNATILIVDDDDSIRSLLHQEFSDAGYLVEEATNGKEALTIIRNHRPDLIVLDVMMPEMNGFDVAAILKNDPQTMDIPIIVLSIVQDKARGYRIGVDRYLTKPIDTGRLFTEVGALLEQGKSRKKVMVVDEDAAAVKTLSDVLQAKGYQVVESDGKELVEKAIASQPDIIILNSVFSGKQEVVQTLRFEKGLENVLFLIYQ